MDVPPMDLDDAETRLLDEISIEVPAKKTIAVRPKPAKPSPFAKRSAGPREDMNPPDDVGMDMFMNPGKRTAPPPPMHEEYDDGEEDDSSWNDDEDEDEEEGN
jgi:hypothetical protein